MVEPVRISVESKRAMHGAHILLIEDDDVLSNVVERNLRARHHDVVWACDAHEALQHLRRDDFDLILLDINLPDQTGWDILRTALAEGSLQKLAPLHGEEDHWAGKIPVVVLSAVRVSPRRIAEFRPLAYLPKPFPMDAALRFAAEAAERRGQQETA